MSDKVPSVSAGGLSRHLTVIVNLPIGVTHRLRQYLKVTIILQLGMRGILGANKAAFGIHHICVVEEGITLPFVARVFIVIRSFRHSRVAVMLH